MEPESSGKRPSDQLQGAPLQDQAVRSGAPISLKEDRNAALTQAAADQPPAVDMVVIPFGERTVKGFADRSQWPPHQETPVGWPKHLETISITPPGSSAPEQISIRGAKAIFFVKTFDGASHSDLRFHDRLTPMECLWVRVTFRDNEVMEGIIRNTNAHVFQAGFFMTPIDSEANNWLLYVIKDSLKDFQILGLRPAPKSLPILQLSDRPAVDAQSPLSTRR